MRYRCEDCGREFDDPAKWVERHGLDTPPYEQFYGCPYCYGNYEEINEEREEDEDDECK